MIPEAGFFNTQVDEKYIALKQEIKQITKHKDYLNEQEFIDLCCKDHVSIIEKKQRELAIDFLDKIGIASYFNKIKTSDYFVLDPNWVTTGLYKILTSKQVANQKGKVNIDELDYILNKEDNKAKDYHPFSKKIFTYKLKTEYNFILQILFRYKLAFKLNDNEFIIPSLLNANPKDNIHDTFEAAKTLNFIYEYDKYAKKYHFRIFSGMSSSKDFERLLAYWRLTKKK